MFVDYAGQMAEAIDGATGEVRQAQVFKAVLGVQLQGESQELRLRRPR